MIVVDIETFDPNLKALGDGSIRKDGYIICVGLYDGKDYVCCEPHERRLADWLASSEDKCYHNCIYDLPWLLFGHNLNVNGTIHDTMTRAALIDEYSDLSLDACCKRMHIPGKNAADTIDKWFDSVRKAYGWPGDFWRNADVVWRTRAGREKIIEYNKQDCIATYNLFMAQEPFMKEHQEAYKLECDILPIIMEMKKNGIRVDTAARDALTQRVETELGNFERQLSTLYGINKDTVASPKKMTVAMNKLGITSPVRTATGNQSWSADALALIEHPAVDLISDVKIRQAILSKYLHSSLVNSLVDGRIHCTFTPNKRDDGGTVTGRLASRNPNLQNIPARDEKSGRQAYGQEMRMLFLPEQGQFLAAVDYTAIEAVILAHYARGRQAEWFRQQVRDGIDFHTTAMAATGITSRDQVKRMNYGIIYGMGAARMFETNRKTFKTLENTQQVFDSYHKGLPVIRDTMNWAQSVAKLQGYTVSIGGRLHHKPKPMFINGKMNDMIYKVTNHLVQGSASELLKKGLLDAWDASVFNTLKLHITVHDENVVSVPYSKEGTEALKEMIYCMTHAYSDRLTVPVRTSCEVGPTWGYWEEDIWQRMLESKYIDGGLLR